MLNVLNFSSQNTLHVSILSREAVLFNGKALALTSLNSKGKFDILPKHAHFISIIHDDITVRKLDGSDQSISFQTAILKVTDNHVEIYIGSLKKQNGK